MSTELSWDVTGPNDPRRDSAMMAGGLEGGSAYLSPSGTMLGLATEELSISLDPLCPDDSRSAQTVKRGKVDDLTTAD